MMIVEQVNDATGPLATRDDLGTCAEEAQQAESGRLLHHIHGVARHEELRNFVREGLGHVLAADVGDALQSKVDVDRIARLQVILDALDDELDQIAVGVDEHGDEEIALRR